MDNGKVRLIAVNLINSVLYCKVMEFSTVLQDRGCHLIPQARCWLSQPLLYFLSVKVHCQLTYFVCVFAISIDNQRNDRSFMCHHHHTSLPRYVMHNYIYFCIFKWLLCATQCSSCDTAAIVKVSHQTVSILSYF